MAQGPNAAPLLPDGPIPLDEVYERFPALRQSMLANYDECALSALYDLRFGWGWSPHVAALGILFHRFAAEMLRRMRGLGEERIPVAEALEILYWAIRQEEVPVTDRVRLPLRLIRELRIVAVKFAKDNRFSVHRIVDIERNLSAEVTYDRPDGGLVTRTLTGTPDLLIAEPPDGAIVLDYKSGWGLPPERVRDQPEEYEDGGQYVSPEGYFQQRWYGFLVMKNYPAVNKVTLREFYPRRTEVREAILFRHQLEHVEREFADLVRDFDLSMVAGTAAAGTLSEDDWWRPSPGRHCSWCPVAPSCPIPKEARGVGAIETPEDAERFAAQREQAWAVYQRRTGALKVWAGTHGPVPLRRSKGRRVVGWVVKRVKYTLADGSTGTRSSARFEEFTPPESDRGPQPEDLPLEAAMAASVAEARRARDAARKKRKRRDGR